MRDQFTNFVIATLQTPMTATTLTATIAAGSDHTLPLTGPYRVAIEQELLDVALYVAPTLTFAARGVEGTTPTAHNAGLELVQTLTAGMLTHLWRNVSDRCDPAVPPPARGLSTSSDDAEFAVDDGAWTLSPSPTGLTITPLTTASSFWIATAQTLGGNYRYWRPFQPRSVPWTLCARLSANQDILNLTGLGSYTAQLFVTDTAPPSIIDTQAGAVARIGPVYVLTSPATPGFNQTVVGDVVVPVLSVVAESFQAGMTNYATTSVPLTRAARYYWLRYDGATLSAAVSGAPVLTMPPACMQVAWPNFTPVAAGFALAMECPVGSVFTCAVDWFRCSYA